MPSGLSGDMLLGALLDAGGDRQQLLHDLQALGIATSISRTDRQTRGYSRHASNRSVRPNRNLGDPVQEHNREHEHQPQARHSHEHDTAMSTNTAMSIAPGAPSVRHSSRPSYQHAFANEH